MTPLPIDDRRVGKLAFECDAIDDEKPRQAGWKERHAAAYRALADACNLAARNATNAQEDARMTDVAAIAAGLSRAQRKALKGATVHEPTGRWRCNGVMHPADRNLRAKGLANGLWVELTPLGLAVRAYLEGQSNA